ncbi:uncharacterized protein UV8b_00004 [Ustilaginoidea virens]|uniref:Fatty acid hydroxylase domain-containing protein n=1 Tax=Ustilaginoidea virens TaxID=1159556 RepID=A0A063BQX9_USTVR|nr:uncharacterized protein UV8b_00004 [Ustilaginoidea virens]QUC15763.1 hypothetical protein UV8b_00004 [Ustilaginoidea virens]GAO20118.1 hypothetical protein UVI_02061570 [Ustilaginoidea virens]
MLDVLLSIPLISYFLFPSTGASLSTSVNLFFFYVTWTSLAFSHNPLEIHLSGLLVLRVVFWLAPALIFLLFDIALPSLSVGFKHGGRSAMPPRAFRKLAGMLGRALLNVLFLLAVEAAISMAYAAAFKRYIFRMSTALPFPWIILKHCLVILASREVLRYYLHRRVLHGDLPLAREHARYAHDRPSAPYSLQVFTDHPLALLVYRFVPIFLPAALIRTHILIYFLVVILTTVEDTLTMSGYTFIPGILMSGITQRTAIHYAGGGSSNYSGLGVMDWVHGTSKGREVLMEVKNSADKHDVQERAAKRVGKGSDIVKDGIDSLKKRARAGN